MDAKFITLQEAAKLFPSRRRDRPVHVSAVYRWALHGARGIKLKTWRTPGGRVTTPEAVREFVEALTTALDGPQAAPPPRASARAAAAGAELAKIGI